MPGLVPGIHVLLFRCAKDVDGRVKPGHDEPIEPDQNTFLIQLCGSLVRPYWMSTSCLRRPIATGPAAPPLMRKSPRVEQTLPIGEITAAVPQAKASFSLPLAASARSWSIV